MTSVTDRAFSLSLLRMSQSDLDPGILDPVIIAETQRALLLQNDAPPSNPTPQKKKKKTNAHWTLTNEIDLLDELKDNLPAVAEGCNFTQPIWNSAAIRVNKKTTKGGPKTWDSCKSKFQKVRNPIFMSCIVLTDTSSRKRSIMSSASSSPTPGGPGTTNAARA